MDLISFQSISVRFAEFSSSITVFFKQQPWILLFVVIFVTLIAERFSLFVFGRIARLTKKTETTLDDNIIKGTRRPVGNYILLFGAFLVIHTVKIPAGSIDLKGIGLIAVKVLVVLNTLWLFWRLTDIFGNVLLSKFKKTNSRIDDQLVPILRKTVKVLIAVLASVYLIQAFGYSISGVIAGLGIGGLAVAMASKDTLSNFFGSLMILSDRPFKVGDWIKTDSCEGVVEEIGLRSTRIRTFPKTLVSVPNSVIANASIDNHSRMPKRRVSMTIGVTYSTTAAQMAELVNRITDLLRSHKGVNQEFMLVNFTDFGASSLDIMVYYFSATTDWAKHLAVRQEINLAIMTIIEEMGLSIAFPTRTVHLAGQQAASD